MAVPVGVVLHAAPSAGFEEPLEMLRACHERIARMLRLLQRLQAHLGANGADEHARAAARDLLRYFDRAGPAHHEDEERHVLPRLRVLGQGALAERLADEHVTMARRWSELRQALQPLAEHGAMPTQALEVEDFVALYQAHIRVEEDEAYVAAMAALDPGAMRAMGSEMAARRGLPLMQD